MGAAGSSKRFAKPNVLKGSSAGETLYSQVGLGTTRPGLVLEGPTLYYEARVGTRWSDFVLQGPAWY